jgi:hypothetical protein
MLVMSIVGGVVLALIVVVAVGFVLLVRATGDLEHYGE